VLTALLQRPDDGGSKHLWNVGPFLPDNTTQHPTRQPSSYSSPWERETSHDRYKCPTELPYLATLLALALLWPPMNPVVVDARLLAVLSHAHIPESGFTRELGPLHQYVNAAGVCNDLACRALHPRPVFLKRQNRWTDPYKQTVSQTNNAYSGGGHVSFKYSTAESRLSDLSGAEERSDNTEE
jgi:hypothetical protein